MEERKERPLQGQRILLLGGGSCQVNIARRAADLGADLFLADYTDEPPAAKYCLVHETISTFDVPACTQAAKKHRVNGVMTAGTDQPVYTCALVAEALGLPYPISAWTALLVTNKKEMKKRFHQLGIPTLPYAVIRQGYPEEALESLEEPLVLKPVDSQGQRGIFKVERREEIRRLLPETLGFSRQNYGIVEEYYDSKEITVSGFAWGGVPHLLTVTDRLLIGHRTHIGVCRGHRFPSLDAGEYYEEICRISERIAAGFEIREGPFYFQFLVGKKGVFVNEIACRIGGAYEDLFIPLVTGFDIAEAVALQSAGLACDPSPLQNHDHRKKRPLVSVELFFGPPGRVVRLTPLEEMRKLPFVRAFGYHYQVGDVILPFSNATTRAGFSLLVGDGEDEDMEEKRRLFYDRLVIETDSFDRCTG